MDSMAGSSAAGSSAVSPPATHIAPDLAILRRSSKDASASFAALRALQVSWRKEANFFKQVLPFILITLVQMLVAGVSLSVLSDVRAYVGGESLWSKGQKDAIYYLSIYADTGDDRYFQKYQSALAVPLGDLNARLALEQADPDYPRATQGLLRGGNAPDDVPGLIWLFAYFRNFPYMSDAVAKWRATDPLIFELYSLGEAVKSGVANGRQIGGDEPLKERIYAFNDRIMPLAVAFSESLGAGSRAIKAILTATNVVITGVLIWLVAWRMRSLLSQRKKFEDALSAEKERIQVTLSSIGDAVFRIDGRACVEYMNPAAERLIGSRAADVRGAELGSLFSIVEKTTGHQPRGLIDSILNGDAKAHSDLAIQSKSRVVPVSLVGTPISAGDSSRGAVLVLHDMTSEQAFIDRLSWQASHDALTELANRREFERRLEGTLVGLAKYGGAHALMFLDLDQFKIVNDTCGHAAGDELLRQTSLLLLAQLGEGALLARLGGDEFGILIENCDATLAADVAERIRSAVQKFTFIWEGRSFNITVSVGLVSLAQPDLRIEEALRTADMACYMAKEKGRNQVQIHQTSDSEVLQRVGEMAWVQRIREAIEHDRFCLYAQKIAPVGPYASQGEHVELLIRLMDSGGGLVPPGSFIPAAERFGLMPLIDRWVVGKAFAMLASSEPSRGKRRLATCAINISGASVGDASFARYLREQFDAYDVPPSLICFEITETGVISNLEKAERFMREFQQLGCRFALDDFGTGMSSFAYLKRLPVDYLKIDGSFVKDILDDRSDRAMVEMIARMAATLGKQTIAEFVESEEILRALDDIGVDYAQGFAIERPRPLLGRLDAALEAQREVA
jgi:diguanylate cyclase (GGDEF)-like protein